MRQDRRGRRVGGKPRKLAACLDIGKYQHGNIVAVGACDHRIAHERSAVVEKLRAQRPCAHPGAARELEVFCQPAIEH
jgi:hypothetical protein